MAVVKKYNQKALYFSPRLYERLETILDFPLTIVEAPTGFGKTTAVKEFMKKSGYPYIWFNVDGADKEKFFKEFTNRVASISEKAAHELLSIGYPLDNRSSRAIAKALFDIEFKERTVLVIDNYHMISDAHMDRVISEFTSNMNSNLVIVVMTQAITSSVTFDLVLKKQLNFISKGDFELNKDEIVAYYKSCGIKLEDDETDFLCQYTEGWISALYLQMLSYMTTNKFEPTDSIENLVSKAIWNNLTRIEQDFLISISVFDSFTIRQALNMYEDKMSEEDITKLLNDSGLIRYDAKDRKYYMHSLLKYFLETEFDKIEPVFKKKIYKNAGCWYRDNEDYYLAITYYYKIKDYEAILNMDYNANALNAYAKKENKSMFIDIASKTPYEIKEKYITRYMIFVYFLFIYNERDMLINECEIIEEIIEHIDTTPRQKDTLLGDLEFIKALTVFNHFDLMIKSYKKAFEYLKAPSTIFSKIGSWTFNCPSVMCTYHREVGKLEKEATIIDEGMPYYYKISDGNGKGGEAVMKAEMLLYKGEYPDAEILCQKAIYMANTRNQISVYLSAVVTLAKVYIIKGDYDAFERILDEMNSKLEDTKKYDLLIMSDLCHGMIYSSINELDSIPTWLTDSEQIEKNCNVLTLGYANLIYGKSLLLKNDYTKLLGVSGQFLQIANIFSNITYKIYTYIYIVICHVNTRQYDKSVNIIRDAIDLAMPDNILLPFAEYYEDIESVIDKIAIEPKYKDFIKNVKSFNRIYARGIKSVAKSHRYDHNFGLTNRELDVAKLAAERMTNKEIADMLFIAESTVKSNLKIIFNKLSINSRSELKDFF